MKLWLDVLRGIQNRGYLGSPVHHMAGMCIHYYKNKYSICKQLCHNSYIHFKIMKYYTHICINKTSIA